MKNSFLLLFSLGFLISTANTKEIEPNKKANNTGYWQQHVDYKMDITMDVTNYRYTGTQQLVYTNNSPDVLTKVYYHLYFNAFQPGSEMDIRSQTIADPDGRVGDRIGKLTPDEIGYINVTSLKQDGIILNYDVVGTVLQVQLHKPIQPGEIITFDMIFDGQVPVQVRRSGRNSSEGVALSMTQWYPKLAEYDFEGWHADPYIGREFHGVWGDFDVTINIDKNYVVGGTGYLQNPNEIGHGYETGEVKQPEGDMLSWHFKAPKVHDFTWAADPEYIHETMQVPDGPMLHFFYKKTLEAEYLENWKKLQPKTVELMEYFSEHIGEYPYEQYSVIQGGDGGMEYAMSTLITGKRKLGSLVGVTAHELAHKWFQFLLATNELKYYWMDEGFTSYISDYAMDVVMGTKDTNPVASAYRNYLYLATSGKEQPLTTHADRFEYNQSYGISAYSKGAVFLQQLAYVIGEENLKTTIKKYYEDFKFTHPTSNDFIRTAEKVSNLELQWYLTDFTKTTNTIDYGVKAVSGNAITLERIGIMPMPIDLTITYIDGTTEDYYIPLRMMRGKKPTTATPLSDWAWAYPTYTFEASKTIKSVQIDPKEWMADVNKVNNKFEF
ncbi:M1 family metallopeptidase [Xanthomarina sp. F2636L]|uniref:M1 family metallopeptidase n=1 Tax=Xanthomarina sp. F2636L TaxID=2996018 RepID=UPI00225DFF9E|nr:M1 family metallopeptidase [Xanthomarina sp. F2636L]MCX7551279.1 M1 family metallopeptidase [Xanthomarina sp. F2636L]